MILRARAIVPFSDSPIDNGAIVIDDGRISWVGRWRECAPPESHKVLDLGEVALLPGLVNAHCHLDYTSMGGKIPPPRSFPDWVKNILAFKAQWSFSEFAESWLKGARMLAASGVTTVGDIESVPELLPQVWEATPLRVVSFLEMTGVKSRRSPRELVADAAAAIDGLPAAPRKQAALSPHALYSTQPELARLAAEAAAARGLRIATHLAESESEFQMFCDAKGPFYDWLKSQRRMDDCGHASPVRLAQDYGLLAPNFIAVHANYLAPGDAGLLARSRSHVVHCPRSHDYFAHDPFPYDELRSAGVNVALGTDSLASIRKFDNREPQLDLWAEMRLFSARHPGVPPREIFEMAGSRAALALGLEKETGVLKQGFSADCLAKTYTGPVHEKRMVEDLLHTGEVRHVFVAGEIAAPE